MNILNNNTKTVLYVLIIRYVKNNAVFHSINLIDIVKNNVIHDSTIKSELNDLSESQTVYQIREFITHIINDYIGNYSQINGIPYPCSDLPLYKAGTEKLSFPEPFNRDIIIVYLNEDEKRRAYFTDQPDNSELIINIIDSESIKMADADLSDNATLYDKVLNYDTPYSTELEEYTNQIPDQLLDYTYYILGRNKVWMKLEDMTAWD